jgi:LuxR family quorum sensing-dependent transcriptional regulator
MASESGAGAWRTLDFIDRLRRHETREDICRDITQEIARYGYSHVTVWSMPGPGDNPADCVLLNTRPQEYIDRYVEKNHVMRDPVVTELRHTLAPFSWSDVRARRDLSKAEKAIVDEGRAFGAHDGMTIPIVTRSGSVAVFSPCGEAPDLSPRARAAVELAGIMGYSALRSATGERPKREPARTPLSAREREIMQYVAAGRSDEEIGDLLALSTRTVTWHVENAKRKLDALRRPQAVVQALRNGEIDL